MFIKNSINYDIKKIIVTIFVILFIYLLLKKILFKNQKEGFNNQIIEKKYIKLSDTQIKNNNSKWKDMTLKQCQMKCNEDKKCIGFSRDNIDDNVKGNCYPKENYNQCYSLRKGNPDQRREAINYNTFIKQHYYNDNHNVLNKCLGDEETTLNREVFIYSYAKPDNYITLSNNQIHSKEFTLKDMEFHKNSKFKIVKGLEGSGTVSFIKTDNNDENYYLSNNDTGYLELIPIDENNSKTLERSNASFELLDGFSDKTKFTIRTFSLVKLNLYLILDGNKKNPRIKLVRKEFIDDKNKKESATFDIVNHITNDSFIDTKEEFQSHNPRRYPKKLRKKYLDTFQNTSENLNEFSSSIDSIVLIDNNNYKLMIPVSNKDTIISANKLDYYIRKYNDSVIKDVLSDEIEVGDLVKLKTDLTKYYRVNNITFDNTNGKDLYKINEYNETEQKYSNNTLDNSISDIILFKKSYEFIERRTNNNQNIIIDFKKTKKGFNKENIKTILITNPNNFSVRIYNYDITKENILDNRKEQNLFDKVNIINDKNKTINKIDDYNYEELKILSYKYNIYRDNKTKTELYNDYLVVEAINNGINDINNIDLLKDKKDDYLFTNIINPILSKRPDLLEKLRMLINNTMHFKIKSLKIFKTNPKELFLKKNDPLNDIFNKKMESLYNKYKDVNSNLSDINYNRKKKKELEEYRTVINKYKNNLENLSNNLDIKAKEVFNKANGYKLNKLAEDYFMLEKTKKSQLNLQ